MNPLQQHTQQIRKIVINVCGILFTLFLFILHFSPIKALDDNQFLCVCSQPSGTGGCLTWTLGDEKCDEPTFSANITLCQTSCPSDLPCEVTCQYISEDTEYKTWGMSCDPSNPNHLCPPHDYDNVNITSCRESAAGVDKCLKSSLGVGQPCKDAIECSGFPNIECYTTSSSSEPVCADPILDPPQNPEDDPDPLDWELCEQIPDSAMQNTCQTCLDGGGLWTAVGCIKHNPRGIAQGIITVLTSIAGGLAILFILYGSFVMTTSQANPERLQNGKTIVTSAIIGLVFILLSVVILRFIGVEVLQLPGFGAS